MNDIKILNQRKLKMSTKITGGIFGLLILASGIYSGSVYAMISGPLILLALMLTKYSIINQDGISIIYDVKFFKYDEKWMFRDIVELHRENIKDPEYVALHFMKGSMNRRLIFLEKDSRTVIKMAMEGNRKIHFDDVK